MLSRRVLSIARVAKSARNSCILGSCKCCIARNGMTAIRSFASRSFASRPARVEKEFEISRLAKPLEAELQHNTRLIKEEELNMDRVNEDYARLIRENSVSIEENAANGEVSLTIPKDGYTFVLKFDPSAVANSVNAANPVAEEEADDDVVDDEMNEVEEQEDDFGDEDGMGSFDVTIEVHRDGAPGTLVIAAEANPAFEEKGYDLYVMDASIKKDDIAAYPGPAFDSLDEEIREGIDKLVAKNFTKFMPLVADYARVKEAHLYQQWLGELKQIVAANNN